MEKYIFMTCFNVFINKNIIDAGVLEKICSADEKVRFVIFVPHFKREFYERLYESEKYIFVGIDVRRISDNFMDIFFSRIAFLLVDSHYLWYKKRERLEASKSLYSYAKYFFESLFTRIFSRASFIRRLYRALDNKLVSTAFFAPYFEQYNPVLVFSTDIFCNEEMVLLREAHKRKVRSAGMVRSWDNCYSKGLLRAVPDIILVNNENIKEELITMHDVDEGRINAVGLPQFDKHFRDAVVGKEDFFKQIGADTRERLILFAPAGTILSDTDVQICRIFKEAIAKDRIPADVRFFVRNHPGHPADLSEFHEDKNFIIEYPGVTFKEGTNKDNDFSKDDIKHLANTLYHCEMVIFIATSLGIDASVFNKPEIIIDFDGYEKRNYINSVRRYHNEDHMKKMIGTGGARVVENEEELIRWINNYLEDPTLDQAGRDHLIAQQLWKTDGQSGKRVADYILGQIGAY